MGGKYAKSHLTLIKNAIYGSGRAPHFLAFNQLVAGSSPA